MSSYILLLSSLALHQIIKFSNNKDKHKVVNNQLAFNHENILVRFRQPLNTVIKLSQSTHDMYLIGERLKTHMSDHLFDLKQKQLKHTVLRR